MRIAVVSDIHGNRTALAAVLADIRRASPDLALHGGDLADGGSSPTEIVDQIQQLGWPGVMGNTDEMLFRPASLEEFASQSAAPTAVWDAIREIAEATRARLGPERLEWLGGLPLTLAREGLALVHATPRSCWSAPAADAPDTELTSLYAALGQPVVVFGHTHCPGIRTLPATPRLLINAGSVGLPFDGDPRAAYLLLDAGVPAIRRVEYDTEKEVRALLASGMPRAEWTARMLRAARPQMP
jgi:predicted phosphodiesterase